MLLFSSHNSCSNIQTFDLRWSDIQTFELKWNGQVSPKDFSIFDLESNAIIFTSCHLKYGLLKLFKTYDLIWKNTVVSLETEAESNSDKSDKPVHLYLLNKDVRNAVTVVSNMKLMLQCGSQGLKKESIYP